MIWNSNKESMSAADKRTLQSSRLKKLVERLYHQTPFYRKKLQELNLMASDISSIDDIVKLPFTTKNHLRENYPYGLFAAPMSTIVRLHASSGTTGQPTVVGYTRRDLAIWSEMMARSLTAFGATVDDIFSVSYGYGLFTGGLGLHYGVEHIGATVVPMSSGNTAKQIQLIEDFGVTALACTPSYALYIADSMREAGIDPDRVALRIGVFGAEPWTENMRVEIEEKLGIDGYNIYGLSEIMGPGVSHECQCKCGSHIIDDHFYPEIIDPDTLISLPYGEQGELVLTTLTKDGLPLLRYRTGDLCSLIAEPCRCGRTSVRMTPIVGRSDDMLIIRGVNLFPSQIESAILEVSGLEPHYLIVVDKVGTLDSIEVKVEVSEGYYSDEINKMVALRNEVAAKIESVVGISAKVKLVAPNSIPRSEGKAVRVIDNRVK